MPCSHARSSLQHIQWLLCVGKQNEWNVIARTHLKVRRHRTCHLTEEASRGMSFGCQNCQSCVLTKRLRQDHAQVLNWCHESLVAFHAVWHDDWHDANTAQILWKTYLSHAVESRHWKLQPSKGDNTQQSQSLYPTEQGVSTDNYLRLQHSQCRNHHASQHCSKHQNEEFRCQHISQDCLMQKKQTVQTTARKSVLLEA